MRKRIYEIIEVSQPDDTIGKCYDIFMLVTIFVSIIPLAFKEQIQLFFFIDKITVIIYIIDYLLRFITADFKFHSSKIKSFISFYIICNY